MICKFDDDCFSGVYKKTRICNNSGITQCLVSRRTTTVHCGKLANQNCQIDDECVSK